VVEDANGCTAVGSDTLAQELGCMQVRPVITPGLEDGKNDFLWITCAESTKNHIEIYNRYGQLVFKADNYDNSSLVWEGKTEAGQPLAEGVYYYVLTYSGAGGEEIVQKGHVNLLR
jgi:gliding motility-associated-like protein